MSKTLSPEFLANMRDNKRADMLAIEAKRKPFRQTSLPRAKPSRDRYPGAANSPGNGTPCAATYVATRAKQAADRVRAEIARARAIELAAQVATARTTPKPLLFLSRKAGR